MERAHRVPWTRTAVLLLGTICTVGCKGKAAPATGDAGDTPTPIAQAQAEAAARQAQEQADSAAARVALQAVVQRLSTIGRGLEVAARSAPACTARFGGASAVPTTIDDASLTKRTVQHLGLSSTVVRTAFETLFDAKDQRSSNYDPKKAREADEQLAAQRWLVVIKLAEFRAPEVSGDKKFRSGAAKARAILYDADRPVCRADANAASGGAVKVIGGDGFAPARLTNDLERALRKDVEAKLVGAKSIGSLDALD